MPSLGKRGNLPSHFGAAGLYRFPDYTGVDGIVSFWSVARGGRDRFPDYSSGEIRVGVESISAQKS